MKVEKIKNMHTLPFEIEQEIRKNKKEEYYGSFSHKSHLYIAISLGQKNTSGYDVSINKIIKTDLELWEIRVQKNLPRKERILAQVMTTPLIVVRVAMSNQSIPKKITFKNNEGETIKTIHVINKNS